MIVDNATIVLTGASSGIGLDLARQLVSRATVIGLSRHAPDEPMLTDNARFVHLPADLSSSEDVADAIASIGQLAPDGIDGLINCAAVQFTPRFTDSDFDPADIAREIAINLTSPIELIAGLLPLLGRGQGGFVLNVNSGLGIVPKRESAVYCATKAGLDNFSRGLRAQLSGTNVRVQQAFLPLVDTPMTEGRGTGKLPSSDVARHIIAGIERGIADNDIGKVKLLRAINRLSPSLANRIMQKGNA